MPKDPSRTQPPLGRVLGQNQQWTPECGVFRRILSPITRSVSANYPQNSISHSIILPKEQRVEFPSTPAGDPLPASPVTLRVIKAARHSLPGRRESRFSRSSPCRCPSSRLWRSPSDCHPWSPAAVSSPRPNKNSCAECLRGNRRGSHSLSTPFWTSIRLHFPKGSFERFTKPPVFRAQPRWEHPRKNTLSSDRELSRTRPDRRNLEGEIFLGVCGRGRPRT